MLIEDVGFVLHWVLVFSELKNGQCMSSQAMGRGANDDDPLRSLQDSPHTDFRSSNNRGPIV